MCRPLQSNKQHAFFVTFKEFLTPQTCADHVIVRGLVRVLMVKEARRILIYLSKKGYVNHGSLRMVPSSLTLIDQHVSDIWMFIYKELVKIPYTKEDNLIITIDNNNLTINM